MAECNHLPEIRKTIAHIRRKEGYHWSCQHCGSSVTVFWPEILTGEYDSGWRHIDVECPAVGRLVWVAWDGCPPGDHEVILCTYRNGRFRAEDGDFIYPTVWQYALRPEPPSDHILTRNNE